MSAADDVIALFERRGATAYLGEPVSQLEHALEAAHFAAKSGAPASLIVAALVHDIGHIVEETPEDFAERGIDGRHEAIGEAWLASRFGPEVCEPVSLHVAAKRYLCATNSSYMARLSPASALSLKLQGGPMNDAEALRFEGNPFYREAIRLRHWDDLAKLPDFETEKLESYRAMIESVAKRQAAAIAG